MMERGLRCPAVACPIAVVCVLLAAGAITAYAGPQAAAPTSSVTGTVSDPTGAVVPGAMVLLTNASGQRASTETNGMGQFLIRSFPVGEALLVVRSPGFPDAGPIPVTVSLGEAVTQNVTLAVPPAATAVEAVGPAYDHPSRSSANYVTVSENAVAGPMGYVAAPAVSNAAQSQTPQQQALLASQPYNFPSIIFYVSAAPLVNLPSSDALQQKQTAQETDQNPQWLDASFTLSFFDANGRLLPSACNDGSVQVLGLMPQQTITALKTRTTADVASAVNDAAGALATFYPGTQGEVTAATKAMNVVFQDIFPPRPVAYEYSYMTDNCNFGWYFRQNKSAANPAAGEASILGIQTGIALLKTRKDVASVRVNGRSISLWDKPPTSSSKDRLFITRDADVPFANIVLPSIDSVDYDNLTSLAMFPALIPRVAAKKILHMENQPDTRFVAFATENKLVGTDAAFSYVTNVSLSAFLNLSTPNKGNAAPAQTAAMAQVAPADDAAPAKIATPQARAKSTRNRVKLAESRGK